MEILARKQFKFQYQALGIYQILGSLVGFVLFFNLINHQGWSVVQSLALDIILLLFNIFSLICGVLCLKFKDGALSFSTINQVLQLLGFGVGSFLYVYASGIHFSIIYNFNKSDVLDFKFGVSKMFLQFNTKVEIDFIQVNLIALIIIIWIGILQQKIRKYNNPEIL